MTKIVVGTISALGFLAFAAVVVLSLLYLVKKLFRIKAFDSIATFLQPHAYSGAFFLAFIASVASLFLSEVLHFQPCVLCWYQRIVMYPQVVLLYVAQLRRERVLTPYLITLNVIGGLISLYHYSLHVLPRTIVPILPCSVQYGGVPCDRGYEFYFGFMTFPLMAWSVFALITFLLTISKVKVNPDKKSGFRSREHRKKSR